MTRPTVPLRPWRPGGTSWTTFTNSKTDGPTIAAVRWFWVPAVVVGSLLLAAACTASSSDSATGTFATAGGDEVVIDDIAAPSVILFWNPG